MEHVNKFIDNALKMSEEAIAQERELIGQSTYALNKSDSKWIDVGLSAAAGYIPLVRLKSRNVSIFFTDDEWKEFCKNEGTSSNHQIEVSTYKDFEVIRLTSRGQQIVLSRETYNSIYYLKELIDQKISLLKGGDFIIFYNTVLDMCTKMDGDLYQNVKSLLTSHENSMNALLMLEALHFAYNTVFFDHEVMKLGID